MKKTVKKTQASNTWDQLVTDTLAALAERTATEYVRDLAYLDMARLNMLNDDPDAQLVYAMYVNASITQNCGKPVMASDVDDAPNEVVDAHSRLVALGWLERFAGVLYDIVCDEKQQTWDDVVPVAITKDEVSRRAAEFIAAHTQAEEDESDGVTFFDNMEVTLTEADLLASAKLILH